VNTNNHSYKYSTANQWITHWFLFREYVSSFLVVEFSRRGRNSLPPRVYFTTRSEVSHGFSLGNVHNVIKSHEKLEWKLSISVTSHLWIRLHLVPRICKNLSRSDLSFLNPYLSLGRTHVSTTRNYTITCMVHRKCLRISMQLHRLVR